VARDANDRPPARSRHGRGRHDQFIRRPHGLP
jgi:hypothetical protein